MSWTLGIDTSTTLLSLGLYNNTTPELSFTRYVHNSHAEHIKDVIKSFLTLANVTAADINKCGVVTGPGSFTGLRIGISFLKGMFITGDTTTLPISSLELLAHAIPVKDKRIVIALDARQDNVFSAMFSSDFNGTIQRVSEDEKLSKDAFYEQLSSNDYIVYDTMGFAKSSVFEKLYDSANAFATTELALSRGLTAAKLAATTTDESKLLPALEIFPNYMQESYAERTQKK